MLFSHDLNDGFDLLDIVPGLLPPMRRSRLQEAREYARHCQKTLARDGDAAGAISPPMVIADKLRRL